MKILRMGGHEVDCVICGERYPLPVTTDDYLSDRHPFTCSDRCQKEFHRRGGLSGVLKKEAEFKLKGR